MTDAERNFDLRAGFLGRQEQLDAALRRGRAQTHTTSAGTTLEQHWADMLAEFLPNRYTVGRNCTIVDSDGAQADQIDIVVYDSQFTPILLTHAEGENVIAAESVYAVFEVKPDLNRANIAYAGDKAVSVRRLARHPGETWTIDGPRRKPPANRIVAGILCNTSTWKDPLGDHCSSALSDLDDESCLNLGCVADAGSFHYTSATHKVTVSLADTALIAFVSKLFQHLQVAGNATAIDIEKYTDDLWHDR